MEVPVVIVMSSVIIKIWIAVWEDLKKWSFLPNSQLFLEFILLECLHWHTPLLGKQQSQLIFTLLSN